MFARVYLWTTELSTDSGGPPHEQDDNGHQGLDTEHRHRETQAKHIKKHIASFTIENPSDNFEKIATIPNLRFIILK